MSRIIDQLYGDNNAETPIMHVFENKTIQKSDTQIAFEIIDDCLEKSETKEEFEKSWSGDLQKKFPNGGWRTINGARVFVNNGKVIAGLGGFNKEIDSFFERKKKNNVHITSKETTNGGKLYGGHVMYNDKKIPVLYTFDSKESAEKRANEVLEGLKFGKDGTTNLKLLTIKDQLKISNKFEKQSELKERTDKLLKEYYEKDKGSKEKVVKRGVVESTAKIEAKKRGDGFSVKPDELEKDKFKVVHNVKGDAEGLTFDQYKEKYGKQLEVTAKNQLEHESKQSQQQDKDNKLNLKEGEKYYISEKSGVGGKRYNTNQGEYLGSKKNSQGKLVHEFKTKLGVHEILSGDLQNLVSKEKVEDKNKVSIGLSKQQDKDKDGKKDKLKELGLKLDSYDNTIPKEFIPNKDDHKKGNLYIIKRNINGKEVSATYDVSGKGDFTIQSVQEAKKSDWDEKTFNYIKSTLKKKDGSPADDSYTAKWIALHPTISDQMANEFKSKGKDKQNKVYKEAEQLGKKKLDSENTEHIKSLYIAASTIDPKYLSKETKDKMGQIIEDIYVNSYVENDKPLYGSNSLKNSLNVLANENIKAGKKGETVIDQKTFDNIQEFIVSALKEQTNRKTTEKKNYKLF